MKIAINTRLLLKENMDGIGLFTFESFKKIVIDHPEVEFVFIFDRKPHPDFLYAKNITCEVVYLPTRHVYLLQLWLHLLLPKRLKKINPDLFIGTDGMIPLKNDIKKLAIIHDLNFEHYPKLLPKIVRHHYLKYFPKYAKNSDRIATVSEFSKQDIIDKYNVPPSKVDVVYNGVNENFKPISDNEKIAVCNKYANGHSFFLFVGTIHPRKNLINLFKAFDHFKSKNQSTIKLLIVGKKMWWTKEIEKTFNNLKYRSDVLFTGRVPEIELHKITAAAFALTYVPIFEGFGIPLIEAMKCSTPIITSNVTSMPEVADNAAILVDPFSVEDIAQGMQNIYTNKDLRAQLIEKGTIHVEKFSWNRTADLLWKSIQKTVKE